LNTTLDVVVMSTTRVDPRTRDKVLVRDGHRCIAPFIDGHAGWCRDTFGNVITRWGDGDPGPQYLQMSHTKEADELMMGKKTTAEEKHLVSLCPMHHTGTEAGSNWEACNRNLIRGYLKGIYGREAEQ
jgi:hypothetical protein